jgi:hypothetical protein
LNERVRERERGGRESREREREPTREKERSEGGYRSEGERGVDVGEREGGVIEGGRREG